MRTSGSLIEVFSFLRPAQSHNRAAGYTPRTWESGRCRRPVHGAPSGGRSCWTPPAGCTAAAAALPSAGPWTAVGEAQTAGDADAVGVADISLLARRYPPESRLAVLRPTPGSRSSCSMVSGHSAAERLPQHTGRRLRYPVPWHAKKPQEWMYCPTSSTSASAKASSVG